MPVTNLGFISDEIDALPVYSDHEHHLPDAFFAEGMTLDRSLERSYVAWTGFVPDGTEASRAALLDNVRFNSYFFWYERGFQQMHGFTEAITLQNWDDLSHLLARHYAEDSDLHWKVLLQKGYERLIQDAYWNPGDNMGHPEAFVPTFRIDKFLYGFHPEQIAPDDIDPWQHYGFAGGTLDDYVAMMRDTVRERHAAGLVAALKCAGAYNRGLDLAEDDGRPPKRCWQESSLVSPEAKRLFSNYISSIAAASWLLSWMCLSRFTGLADREVNPMQLIPILERYPQARFVLFHTGYPWTSRRLPDSRITMPMYCRPSPGRPRSARRRRFERCTI